MDRIVQAGTMMQRAAKLNLDNVQCHDPADPGCPVNQLGDRLWQGYATDFSSAMDADNKWDTFNQYAIQLLLLNGATWEKGPHVRGKLPNFHKVHACAPQEASGCLASPRLILLQAVLRSLRELEFRFQRDATGPGDW